jgi:uncharacterized protein (UPF0332 family)
MAFADDLLEQAYHLARRERTKLRQASLRRSVSTAYYALFHLLIREAVSNWRHGDHRAALARAFDHGPMKKASQRVIHGKFLGSPAPTVAHLKVVANAFIELQEARHLADYDDSKQWSRTDALKVVDQASAAFDAWRVIKGDKIAQDYLLQLLVQRR